MSVSPPGYTPQPPSATTSPFSIPSTRADEEDRDGHIDSPFVESVERPQPDASQDSLLPRAVSAIPKESAAARKLGWESTSGEHSESSYKPEPHPEPVPAEWQVATGTQSSISSVESTPAKARDRFESACVKLQQLLDNHVPLNIQSEAQDCLRTLREEYLFTQRRAEELGADSATATSDLRKFEAAGTTTHQDAAFGTTDNTADSRRVREGIQQLGGRIAGLRSDHRLLRRDARASLLGLKSFLDDSCFDIAASWAFLAHSMPMPQPERSPLTLTHEHPPSPPLSSRGCLDLAVSPTAFVSVQPSPSLKLRAPTADSFPRVQIWTRLSPSATENSPPAVVVPDPRTVEVLRGMERHVFRVDRAFGSSTHHDTIAADLHAVCDSVMNGRNVCIATYGDSGTGKTHTLEGRLGSDGIISQSVVHLLTSVNDLRRRYPVRITVTAYEVLGDKLRDVLNANAHRVEWTPVNIPTAVSRLEIQDEADWVSLRSILFALRHSRANTHPLALSARVAFVLSLAVESFPATDGPKAVYTRSAALTFVELPAADVPLDPNEPRTKELALQIPATRHALFTFGDVLHGIHRGRTRLPTRNAKLTALLHGVLDSRCFVVLIVCISTSRRHSAGALKSLVYGARIKDTVYTVLCDDFSCALGKQEEDEQSRRRPRRLAQPVELLNCGPWTPGRAHPSFTP